MHLRTTIELCLICFCFFFILRIPLSDPLFGIDMNGARTCPEGDGGGGGGGGGGIMLFGVRLREGNGSSLRKSVSMNNLCQYEQDFKNNAAGYASDDVVHPSHRCHARKRGIPWTEEEHRLFLLGLEKVGKGDWRGISRNFVKSRTPTQVASHAQKYFLRRNNFNRRRRRSSLFDITAETFTSPSMEDDSVFSNHEAKPPPVPPTSAAAVCDERDAAESTLRLLHSSNFAKTRSSKMIRPMPTLPMAAYPKFAQLNINERTKNDPLPLTLKLSTPHSEELSPAASQSSGGFQTMSGGGGDGIDIVSVA